MRRVGNKGLALRWLSSEVHTDSVEAMLRQCRASSWEEFVSPMDGYLGPCSNQVYADADGNIGYQAIGKVPRRRSRRRHHPLRRKERRWGMGRRDPLRQDAEGVQP